MSDDADRSGVARQAGYVPDQLREAIAALDSDESIAVLVTIHQSGQTRYSWIRQELALPDEEIITVLGRLHSAGLIEMTRVGQNEGAETAYLLTDLGAALLSSLTSVPDTLPDRTPGVTLTGTAVSPRE